MFLDILVKYLNDPYEHHDPHQRQNCIKIHQRDLHDNGLLLRLNLKGRHQPAIIDHHDRKNHDHKIAEKGQGYFELGQKLDARIDSNQGTVFNGDAAADKGRIDDDFTH